MTNLVNSPQGKSGFIAFDHSPPIFYLFEKKSSATGNYANYDRSFL
jgi:hypothetical protein